METLPFNFLGLPEKYCQYREARFAVLPIPYDLTTSYMSGTRHGPAAIIAASDHVEWFDEELEAECYQCGIATMDAVEPHLAGPEAMEQALFEAAKRVVQDGKFLFSFGGDHETRSYS